MLSDGYTGVLGATGRDDLLNEVVRFTRSLGFATVTATVAVDHPGLQTEFFSVNNAPAAYRPIHDNLEMGRSDPVMSFCKRANVPLVWCQQTYVLAGEGPRWEMQAAFGYRTGIAYAMHLPHRLHFFLGVDRAEPLLACSNEVSRMVGALQLFAAHAVDVASQILVPTASEGEAVKPTARELECLRWTMEGKTAWEVGRILGISESTVVRHVNKATHKLNCVNKHQAVVKALRAGLIG